MHGNLRKHVQIGENTSNFQQNTAQRNKAWTHSPIWQHVCSITIRGANREHNQIQKHVCLLLSSFVFSVQLAAFLYLAVLYVFAPHIVMLHMCSSFDCVMSICMSFLYLQCAELLAHILVKITCWMKCFVCMHNHEYPTMNPTNVLLINKKGISSQNRR